MGRNLSPRTQQITTIKDSVGGILQGYARAKADRPVPLAVHNQVTAQIDSVIPTAEAATMKYKSSCDAFLAEVIKARGIPMAVIAAMGTDEDSSEPPLNPHANDHFDKLLPLIRIRLDWAVQNYLNQAQTYRSKRYAELSALLDAFLQNPPRLAKDIGQHITPIKREVAYLEKWSDTFAALKTFSFPGEVQFILDYHSRAAIAVRWKYSNLDDQMDDIAMSDHRLRNDMIYTVKNNWALREGLMVPSSAGYIEDTDIPGRQLGCVCSLSWITDLSDLPDNMLTEPGRVRGSRAGERGYPVRKKVGEPFAVNFIVRLLRKVFQGN